MNILLVEDNPLDAMVFQRTMKKVNLDANVVHAQDGVEALNIVNAEHDEKKLPHPYFILLDINMPRMNGHEFLKQLRTESEAKTSIAFVFTTSSSTQDISRAYEGGANGYIVKPTDTAAMGSVLECLQNFWNICEPTVPLT